MTAAATNDRESADGVARSIVSSTATVEEVFTLLRPSIEAFRASAPLGISSPGALSEIVSDLRSWAVSTRRRIGTLSELAAGEVSVAVRVDVDMAIEDSPTLADTVLGEVAATWSILHTAGYAGYYAEGSWYRHVALASLYQALAEHGEIALHVDPFGWVAVTQLDPRVAIVSELGWLRDAVGPVRGVSAHDAAPVHRAENFEIFRQWTLDVAGVERDEAYAAVAGSLDAVEAGIEWCAGAPRPGPGGASALDYLGAAPPWPLQSEDWMRTYLHDGPYCRWFDGCDVWLIGSDRWVVSDRVNDHYHHAVSWEIVRGVLDGLDVSVPVSVCIHPVYVASTTTPR